MRPRKRVLLYCADYDRRNDLAFVLGVRCPWARFEIFADVEELRADLHDVDTGASQFDCVLLVIAHPGEHVRVAEQIDVDFLLQDSEVAGRSVEVRVKPDVAWSPMAMRRVQAGDIGQMAEELKTAAARKRGPKKVPPEMETTEFFDALRLEDRGESRPRPLAALPAGRRTA